MTATKPEKTRFNSSRWYLERWIASLAAAIPEGSLVLDAGAGNCLYRKHFEHTRYETADFCQVDKQYGQIDYVCDLELIPVPDCAYDVVLCTQVLEHVKSPQNVLLELHRLLAPGGRLCLSAPLFYEEHERPHDYYRYTQFGLRHQLKQAGFQIERLEWLEGFYGTLSYQFLKASLYLPRSAKDYGGGVVGAGAAAAARVMRPVFAHLSKYYGWLDVRHKFTQAGYCKNYCLVARKQ